MHATVQYSTPFTQLTFILYFVFCIVYFRTYTSETQMERVATDKKNAYQMS